jgi:hypothetical protein
MADIMMKVAFSAGVTSDTAHTVTISGIFTSIQYNGEIDQVSAVLTYFLHYSNLRHLTTRISTSAQNLYDIKNKHQSI